MLIHTIYCISFNPMKIRGRFPFRRLYCVSLRKNGNSKKSIHNIFVPNVFSIFYIDLTMDFTVVNFMNTVYTNWKVSLKLPFINIQTSFVQYAACLLTIKLAQVSFLTSFTPMMLMFEKSIQSKLSNTLWFLSPFQIK